eukprot:g4462.t1
MMRTLLWGGISSLRRSGSLRSSVEQRNALRTTLGTGFFSTAKGMHDTKIAFIGGGKMAQAILSGLLANEILNTSQISVADPNTERRAELDSVGVQTFHDNKAAVKDADLILFANKPQHCEAIFEELSGEIGKDTLVVSICAGVQIQTFMDGLSHERVIRTMPNTPATIQQGVTVWCASPHCSPTNMQTARTLLSSFGVQEQVSHEDYLDMATALSGSGPAYFFLLMETLVDVGVHMGFPRDTAIRLVQNTALGSANYAKEVNVHPTLLRNDITSPGGTTAAALYAADRGNFRTVVSDAVWAAFHRSRELNDGSGLGENIKKPA